MRSKVQEDESVPVAMVPIDVVSGKPRITVLLPVYNECMFVESCIDRIVHNGYPVELLEILVVDGMSTDGTREIVEGMKELYPQIRLLDNPRRLPYTALNIGLEDATGDFIMRIDARSVIPKDYISNLYFTLIRTGADNVGGMQRPFIDGPVWKRAIAFATMSKFGTGGARFRSGRTSGFVDTV